MPTFDGGHYFLTALIPIRTDLLEDPGGVTSPVHALRKVLAQLPASPTLWFDPLVSPFTASRSLHFVRFVIIDDVAYNGRLSSDALLGKLTAWRDPHHGNPVIAQEQDHLNRPYMLLAMDFDAADGSSATRDAFLRDLWRIADGTLRDILQYAVGFDKAGANSNGFATYISECQIETTLPFNDYYVDKLDVVDWTTRPSTKRLIYIGAGGAIALGLGLLGLLFALFLLVFGVPFPNVALIGALLVVLGVVALVVIIYDALRDLESAGATPFPTGQGTTLPGVLKALHLQRAFGDLAIANQVQAAAHGAAADAVLHQAFGAFLAREQPSNLAGPTQSPGDLGITP